MVRLPSNRSHCSSCRRSSRSSRSAPARRLSLPRSPGAPALSAEFSAQVDGYNQRLAEAYAEATGLRAASPRRPAPRPPATRSRLRRKRPAATARARVAARGARRCATSRIHSVPGQERAERVARDASEQRAAGEKAMATLRDAAARGDQNAFMAGAEGVFATIAALNAIDPRPIINNTGAVVVSREGYRPVEGDGGLLCGGRQGSSRPHDRQSPVFVPMSLGEATRRQALGSAMHGWILAGAIDVLPLFFLVLTSCYPARSGSTRKSSARSLRMRKRIAPTARRSPASWAGSRDWWRLNSRAHGMKSARRASDRAVSGAGNGSRLRTKRNSTFCVNI